MAREKPKKTARSAFDLRTYGGDHRTQQARRFHTIRQSLANQVPTPHTGSQDALLTQAATFALLAEQEAARIVVGDPEASATRFTEYSRRSMALLTRLGIVPRVGNTGHKYTDEDQDQNNAGDTADAVDAAHQDTAAGLIASILAV